MKSVIQNPDAHFMARALTLAQKGAGFTSPNPMVGAVIVKNGKILAEGYHHRAGADHAEIDALKKLKFKAKGATLYCNLEPCFHQGKTPPCVHPVIASGISRVVIANKDPNPKVKGRSIKLLKQKGISVTTGVLEKEGAYLNRIFFKWIQTQRPYVILKVAMSLDGKITPPGKTTGWITGPQSLKAVHRLRSQLDAILVGSNTIRRDDPQLNVRGLPKAHQPVRIILDSRLSTPSKAKIFHSPGGPVWIAAINPKPSQLKRIYDAPAKVLSVDSDARGYVSVKSVLTELSQRGVTSLLVEGGGRVFSSFLNAGLADELIFFVAPKVFGRKALDCFPDVAGVHSSLPFEMHSVVSHGSDWEFRFVLRRS